MVFRKGGGKNTSWNRKGERVEEVQEMLYLGIKMQRNGDLTNHIREKMKRANVMMKQEIGRASCRERV